MIYMYIYIGHIIYIYISVLLGLSAVNGESTVFSDLVTMEPCKKSRYLNVSQQGQTRKKRRSLVIFGVDLSDFGRFSISFTQENIGQNYRPSIFWMVSGPRKRLAIYA